MAGIKVSIIVPVYNVEPYLPICVESIVAQTYRNLEIILVDDGSPDNCPRMCDEYAKLDGRISVVHKENGGLSSARNAGLDVMSGNYVLFVDSDDWIDSRYVEYLLALALEFDVKVAICDLFDSRDGCMPKSALSSGEALSSIEALKIMLYQTGFTNSASGKLFHVSLLESLYFPTGVYHEDLKTIHKPIFESITVAYGRTPLYCYVHRSGSISHSPTFDKNYIDLIDAVDDVCAFVRANCPELIPAANCRKFSCYSQSLYSSATDPSAREESDRLWDWIKRHRFALALDNSARKKNRIAACLSYLGKKAYIALYSHLGRRAV